MNHDPAFFPFTYCSDGYFRCIGRPGSCHIDTFLSIIQKILALALAFVRRASRMADKLLDAPFPNTNEVGRVPEKSRQWAEGLFHGSSNS